MALSKTWNNTVYSIPQSGERGWATLTNFLAALADSAQTTNKQIVGRRVVTASPATVVATTDCYIGVNVASAVAAINLPAGVNGQVFIIADESNAAGTYNITVTPNGVQTINGAASFVLNQNKQTIYILYSGGNWVILHNSTDVSPISSVTDSSKIDLTVTAGVLTATIVADSLVNADINSAAAIAYSKLSLTDSILNADINSAAAIAYAKLNLAGGIVNADINAAAAIAYSKLNLAGSIVNADINASAAIVYSKLSLTDSILNADINSAAAIAYSKLNLAGSIVNADINASAAVAYSKLNLTGGIVDADLNASSTISTAAKTQTLTNKTLTGAIISDYTEYTETTAPTTPAAGKVRIYAKSSDSSLHIVDSSGTDTAIGSGGGSGVGARNYLETSYDFETDPSTGMVTNLTAAGNRASNTTVWGANTTALLTQTATALRGSFSAQLVNGSSASNFIESPMFALDTVDVNTNQLFISFDMNSTGTSVASGDWLVQVIRYDSSGTFQENITPSITSLPSGYYNFKCAFSHSVTAADQYSVRFRSNTATARTLTIDSIIVGPQAVVDANALGPWLAYTPTITGFGTTTNLSAFYRRVGDSVQIKGFATTGTPTAALASITLPSGFAVDTSKIRANASGASGFIVGSHGIQAAADTSGYMVTATTTSSTVVYWAGAINGANSLTAQLGNALYGVSKDFSFSFEVPISQWTTTVTLAGNPNIEYASNSSSTDAADTSSFVYGAQGSVGVLNTTALTGSRLKRVRFQTPIQPTDRIVVEISQNKSLWYPIISHDAFIGVSNLIQQNGVKYGIGIDSAVVNSTDIDIVFGQYSSPTGATFGSAGNAWNATTTSYWRVAKYSGVGLAELAPATATSVGSISRECNWTAYTPTFTNLGTTSNASAFYKIIGDSLFVKGSVTAGTTVASLATVSIPGSFTISAAKLSLGAATNTQTCNIIGSGYGGASSLAFNMIAAPGSSTGLVYNSAPFSTGNCTVPANANATITNGGVYVFEFEVPIV